MDRQDPISWRAALNSNVCLDTVSLWIDDPADAYRFRESIECFFHDANILFIDNDGDCLFYGFTNIKFSRTMSGKMEL